MTKLDYMRVFAEWLGWGVMACGGLCAAAGLVLLTCELCWKAMKHAQSVPWLFRAIRHYSQVEPSPFQSKDAP